MYYILRFSDSWSIYDCNKQESRLLEKAEIDCIKRIFPTMGQENQILSVIEINSIQPNKLLKLPFIHNNLGAKKPTEITPKIN